MIDARLSAQVAFIREIDKLKSVLRMNTLADGSRRENTAEHSWHMTLMLFVLQEYGTPPGNTTPVDMARALTMGLLHDIVEIDAGDTYCYDTAAHADKEHREQTAATRLFGLLPDDQRERTRGLWDEFEAGITPEARLARAVDRLNPFLLNYFADGESWRANGIARSQVEQRMAEVRENCPALWPLVCRLIDDAVAKGWLAKS